MRPLAQPLPEMDPEPEVFEDLAGVLKAFVELQGDRAESGLLSWQAASCWCADHGIHGEERLRWCRLLTRMATADALERSQRRKGR